MIQNLLQIWSRYHKQPKAVLCSVIAWKGSVPRKDYPMMLVLEDGTLLGTIGGGSMELKISQSAMRMIDSIGAEVFDFDMTGKDVEADMGLCGGTLKVLVEPFTQSIQTFYEEMLLQAGHNQKLMVKLNIHGKEMVRVEREMIVHKKDIQEPDTELQSRLKSIFENQRTKFIDSEEVQILMWQSFTPPTIHIFGAGHVGQATADLAHFNDLPVIVHDDRMGLLTSERFPHAQRLQASFPINREDDFGISDRDFVLIASREHKHDRELLATILQTPPAYLGLVSSARKWKLLSESLNNDGFSDELLNRVHAPVGLDINAQTVPEIAVSIISEMISVYRTSAS